MYNGAITRPFNQYLNVGEKYEDWFASYLLKKYGGTIKRPFQFERKYWDLYSTATRRYYEIKSDGKSKYTGNLGIEFQYRGNPSGLFATKADYWVHFFWRNKSARPTCVVFYTKDLRAEIHSFYSIRGGDNNASKMFLIPIVKLETLSSVFDIIENVEIEERS